jgi:hypothetical protein
MSTCGGSTETYNTIWNSNYLAVTRPLEGSTVVERSLSGGFVPGDIVRCNNKKDDESEGLVVGVTKSSDVGGWDVTVLWSVWKTGFFDFSSVTFPKIRTLFMPKLGPDLIGIQPMTLPSGSIFYIDYKYGTKKIK